MKKHTHTFDIAFSVESDHPNAYACIDNEKEALLKSLQKRIRNVFYDNEYREAVGFVNTSENDY